MNAILQAIRKSPSLSTLPLRVEEGYLPALITQTTGAMRAAAAALLRQATGRPIAVICADDAAAATLSADLAALLSEQVTILSSRDPVLRDTEVVSRQSEQQRLRALDAIAAGAGVSVITAAGLVERTLPPDVLSEAAFTLTVGEGEGPEALEPKLLACGYRRSDMVEGPGQFSRRGAGQNAGRARPCLFPPCGRRGDRRAAPPGRRAHPRGRSSALGGPVYPLYI